MCSACPLAAPFAFLALSDRLLYGHLGGTVAECAAKIVIDGMCARRIRVSISILGVVFAGRIHRLLPACDVFNAGFRRARRKVSSMEDALEESEPGSTASAVGHEGDGIIRDVIGCNEESKRFDDVVRKFCPLVGIWCLCRRDIV
ncbi:hypothetical protein PsYK624_066900 [Phanerochaete sordida]|uniref:Uncharacterized protein n=1 Tax=Phanerochaete sordida TaxID=48140 RepID=A0A9P3LDG1_9APHY|nr:hypothetical protein PsYK624_066900 [Phanerochaete sordida]